ncbi:MAG: hypothetical protein H7X84_10115 [Verrucomicrobia bacterium]|nr:hypothetical protein [Prolixibacteraceae bacterium]
MGALEAIVVVYLRQLYYPVGFDFPLTMLTPKMVSVEWLREAATVVMLIAIGMIAGNNSLQRFAWFLYAFAVWDIFYYVWLMVLLNWPSSLFTWDILFLIPVPWVGPVLAPVICSLTMILLGALILHLQHKELAFRIKPVEWSLIILGALVILATFLWDYSAIIINDGLLSKFWVLTNDTVLLKNILMYIPMHYNWIVFGIGEILILTAVTLMYKRVK